MVFRTVLDFGSSKESHGNENLNQVEKPNFP